MPQKHSKNNGSSTYGVFSVTERRRCAFMQNEEARVGVDGQLPFGFCALSLRPCSDPVVTPSGHIYDRESLLEHMVTKTAELKRQYEEWEEQERRARSKELDGERASSSKALVAFEDANDPLLQRATKRSKPDHPGYPGAAVKSDDPALVVKSDPAFASSESLELALKRTSPWLPRFTPEAQKAPLAKPEKRPPSPMTGAPLRAKDLVPLNLEASESVKLAGDLEGTEVRYLCHVTKDEITTQDVLLIKSTGCVVLQSVASKLNLLETLTCPTTGAKFKRKDLIPLQNGVSGYAHSGGARLQVKRYRATGGGA